MHARHAIPVSPHHQRGAAFMVMLVVLIVGITAIFVTSLNSSSILLARNVSTADALAKAKDALIGYAAKDPNRPGELPCPDFNGDGVLTLADDFVGSNCKTQLGRLPWRTLGLPDLVDGSGERLWYAVSNTFRTNSTAVLNSETPGTITVRNSAGNIINNGCSALAANCPSPGASDAAFGTGAVAVIFSPGTILTRFGGSTLQDRSSSGSNTASNYLDANAIEDNASFVDGSSTDGFIQGEIAMSADGTGFNDQILVINHDQLFAPVEMRIARETRSCLEQYASTSSSKYPWAAPISPASYVGKEDQLFGRIPDSPNVDVTTSVTTPATTTISPISSTNSPDYAAISSALYSMKIAIDACNPDGWRNAALQSAATALQTAIAAAPNPPYSAAFISNANTLINMATAMYDGGDKNACEWIDDNGTFEDNIKDQRSLTRSILNGLTVTITTPASTTSTTAPATGMLTTWTTGCFASAYWPNWKSNVFYQVDTQYKPNGTLSSPSLSLNGSGNYRAMVLIARNPLTGVTRAPDDSTTYLEGANRHQAATTTTFTTYSAADSNYSTVNDLALCLDGNINCK